MESVAPNFTNEQLQTLEIDDEINSEQLNRWIENSLVCLTFLAILSLHEYINFSAFLLILPLLLSSVKQMIMIVYKRKDIIGSLGKCVFGCEIVATSANLIFYLSLPLLWGRIPTSAIAAPLALEVLSKVVMRWMITSECFLFSELVSAR